MWAFLIPCLVAGPVDTGFPDWKRTPSAESKPARPKEAKVAPHQDQDEWIVVREHPAMGRDSTSTVELGGNPLVEAFLWPFDHILRPSVRLVMKPIHSAVDYGESTNMIDRGVRIVHPTGNEDVWLYPVTTVDGSEGSRWGLVYMDKDLFGRKWSWRASGAVSVAQDASASVSGATERWTPAELAFRFIGGVGRSRSVGIRVPDDVGIGDRSPTGMVSHSRANEGVGILGKGPVTGSGWDLGLDQSWHKSGSPARIDQVLPDTIPWFHGGTRGTKGEETDRSVTLSLSWSDQNLSGAPTSGGPLSASISRTWADGGGDVLGVSFGGARCFLLGKERYVYRKEDLRPYLDMDPREIVKILDPTTLRERLTQRKILILGFRYSHIEELQADKPVSYFLFPAMGGDAPARGYPSGQLMDHTVAGTYAEYRWPIWKFLDGVAFAELAWSSPGIWLEDADRLAPGGGGGFRARLDRLFLFRGYLAFGRSGMTYSLTTTSEF